MPEGAIYVGRPTRRGNPWRVYRVPATPGIPGSTSYWMVRNDRRNWYPSSERVARRFAVAKFRRWLVDNEFARRLLNLDELRGRDLCCWCRPDQPCHADVLLELANA